MQLLLARESGSTRQNRSAILARFAKIAEVLGNGT
jgi:hypothetical protein